MGDEPRDTHRDLPQPRDIRHDWEYPTFRELRSIQDERDKRYEQRFTGIEDALSRSVTALIVLGFIAALLLIATLVVFLSGHVH
jgi:hypothetical protein